MGKKFYVDGGILINTPYFKCIDGGCGFKDQPEDTEILNTNHIIDGEHCLLIDDEHPQSIFNEYYAKTFYTSWYMGSSYIRHSYWDCYKEYEETINRLSSLLDKIKGLDNEEQSTLNKMAYLNVISAFDSFFCSILLVRLVNNENAFNLYADKVFSINFRKELDILKANNEDGKREQKIIEKILETSFASIKNIKDAMKYAGFSIEHNDLIPISFHFRNRHILIHRNGKKKDGEYLNIGDAELTEVSDCTNKLTYKILTIIADIVKKENDNKPKDTRPIPQVLTAENGLKLSDIARVLFQNQP